MDGTFPSNEDSPCEASAPPHVVQHQRDVAARRGRPSLERKKRKREGENRSVMIDGTSPSLPAPQTDDLFSLPQLSFLPPSPSYHSSVPPSLFSSRTAVSAKVTPPTPAQPFAHPKTHSTGSPALPSAACTSQVWNFYLHNTA